MKYRRFKTDNNKYVLLSSFLVVGLLLGFVMYSSFAKFRQERTVDIIGGVVSGSYDVNPPTLSVNENVLTILQPGVESNYLKEYEYYVTTGSDVPDENTVPTGVMSNNSLTITSGVDSTVYVRTVDIRDRKSAWSTGYSVVFSRCEYEPGHTWEFAYTGNIQNLTVPCDGVYKLEVYGGKGGNAAGVAGGSGGHSVGYTQLAANTSLYVVVGNKASNVSKGSSGKKTGGYNGGGYGYSGTDYTGAGGGGATHIATRTGLLSELESYKSSVLIVAGGGGGANKTDKSAKGGTGGGETGGKGAGYSSTPGGTQTAGGNGKNIYDNWSTGAGSFGTGGHSSSSGTGGGGGAGYYGGGGGVNCSGGGGSGYIGGVQEFTFKGTTYSPMTENGINADAGSATITLIAY